MKYSPMTILFALFSGCLANSSPNDMTLTFGAYSASPVVLTHFSIESPLEDVPPQVIAEKSDVSWPRTGSTNLLSAPEDVNHDNIWHVSAQWVELPTDKAWRAEINVPVKSLTVTSPDAMGSYNLGLIFGPNGLLLIGSDKAGNKASDKIDVAHICGQRVPPDDTAWRTKTGYFPELPIIMKTVAPVKNSECPFPKR